MKSILYPGLSILFVLVMISLNFSCQKEEAEITPPEEHNPPTESDSLSHSQIRQRLRTEYQLMPEEQMAISKDSTTYAQYSLPVTRYRHGILVDQVEAGQLVVVLDGKFYDLTLEDTYVFEDIRPRLADVDADGVLEIVTIRSHLSNGAGIAIYKVLDDQLQEYARVEEIGLANRWLNPVAIADLDQNGTVEIVWIQTPHIGGILKIASFAAGTLSVLDETSFYSNHAIGERNLCLSVLTQEAGEFIFYVPSQNRNQIVGFSWSGDKLEQTSVIDQSVDFSTPLVDQYPFNNMIDEEDNCIF
ncbi:MAG: VCBS repeat-containing protein [Saprospiraceae bacterium]|nr:VCBS repeat-containing protein [Saprospiraceae bacterium]